MENCISIMRIDFPGQLNSKLIIRFQVCILALCLHCLHCAVCPQASELIGVTVQVLKLQFFLQILHNLSVWSATNDKLDQDQVKKDSGKAKKDFKIVSTVCCCIQGVRISPCCIYLLLLIKEVLLL